jgi:hypothetical protein
MQRLFTDSECFRPINLDREPKWVKQDLKDLYLISSKGRIKDLRNNKIYNGFKNSNGYLAFDCIGRSGKHYRCAIHHLVADAFLDNSHEDLYKVVNHKDENKMNADYHNLEWCTSKYNSHYSVAKNVKLSPEQIVEIDRYLSLMRILKTDPEFKIAIYATSEPPYYFVNVQDLADYYNTSRDVIYKIKRKEGYYGWVLYNNFLAETEKYEKFIVPLDVIQKAWDIVVDTHYLSEVEPWKEKPLSSRSGLF